MILDCHGKVSTLICQNKMFVVHSSPAAGHAVMNVAQLGADKHSNRHSQI